MQAKFYSLLHPVTLTDRPPYLVSTQFVMRNQYINLTHFSQDQILENAENTQYLKRLVSVA